MAKRRRTYKRSSSRVRLNNVLSIRDTEERFSSVPFSLENDRTLSEGSFALYVEVILYRFTSRECIFRILDSIVGSFLLFLPFFFHF